MILFLFIDYYDNSRRSQMYWTTDATKALIRLRGEREAEFEQGGARKSQLWVDICRLMREMGYDFTAEKVSKKWHNIMITYNKNIGKKVQAGAVNWEFFEDIDIIYKNKRTQSYDDSYPRYDPIIPSVPQIVSQPLQNIKRKHEQKPITIPDNSFYKIEKYVLNPKNISRIF